MKIAVVSGGFDPIHSGHIDYISEAKKNADYLIVALNSDNWLSEKRVSLSWNLMKENKYLNQLNMSTR